MLTQESATALMEAIENLFRSEQYVRSEILVLLLINTGLPFSLINVGRVGTLHRPYVMDTFNNGNTVNNFNFSLSRAGIYDKLPAGVFHQFINEPGPLSKAIQQYRQHRAEEQNARLFFEPWERELFYQRMLAGLYLESAGCDITMILGDPEDTIDFPADALRKIRLLLPYLHKIAGCIHVSAYLSWILDEQVAFIQKSGSDIYYTNTDSKGKAIYLGVNTMTGGHYYSDIPVWKVSIGPLNKSAFDFMPFQPYGRVVNLCYKYLLPCHIEIMTEYLQLRTALGALLCGNNTRGRIGLNLAI